MAYRVRVPEQNAQPVGRLSYPNGTGDTGDSGDAKGRNQPYPSQPDQHTGQPESHNPADGIYLALKVGGYVAKLPAHQSATASEIAKALHGQDYTLDHVVEAYHVCEELREARILMRGRDGYGYQLSCSQTGTAPR